MLATDALGLTLAEDATADIDLPLFDKAAFMDGYAVRSALDLADPVSTASGSSRRSPPAGCHAPRSRKAKRRRIMTGAPLPLGADAVVMVERSRLDGSTVILPGPVSCGLNRLSRGREMKSGEVLLTRGARIDATKLGLIASAGRAEVLAIPRPTIAVVPTGDELVSISRRPEPGQIRNTNGVMLAGLARAWGARQVHESPVAPDDPEKLREALCRELQMREDPHRPAESIPGPIDVLIVSGGVSAGTKDLVPAALLDLGVEQVFHKVSVKPGKPLWFGVGPTEGTRREGSLASPAGKSGQRGGRLPPLRPSGLSFAGGVIRRRTSIRLRFGWGLPTNIGATRPTYHPSRLQDGQIFPLDWAGSADLRTVALADGFATFPSGDREFSAGEEISFLPLD